MPEVDLTNCDREPIHIIGHAQPHGVLLALDPKTLAVDQVSASAEAHFGLGAEAMLGRSFLDYLPARATDDFVEAAADDGLQGNPTHLGLLAVNARGPFHLVAHTHDGVLVLEAEPADPGDETDYRALPRRILRRLQAATTSEAFYDAVVQETRAMTGFDRVMLYRFRDDGSGVVVAEDAEPHLEPFLGLNYPASDIPQQARRLFALNPVRLYPDVDYAPSPIQPTLNAATGRALDMTYCALRGVSSMHTKYLQNMGVKASMALAITEGDRLWGLVAAHHYVERKIPYPLRASCELLAGLASLLVVEKESAGAAEERARMHDVLHRLVGRVQLKPQIPQSLTEGPETILDLIPSTGAALVVGDEAMLLGATPAEGEVRALVAWLGENQREPLWALAERATAHSQAVGLLSAQVSQAAKAYVLWFRPETVETVRWAGDPNKPFADGETLTPRSSFEVWKQAVAGRAQPWLPDERIVAERLRLALVEALIHRADEILRLNVELERRNEDLDAFAHVAAHDLKEPLRGIRNYAQFVEEDYGDRLDDEGRAQVATIVRLSARLEGLLDSLLRFARVSREELGARRCDLGATVADAEALLASALQRANGTIVVEGALPTVSGDPDLILEIFVNLITNALKYNDSGAPRIEIASEGHAVTVRDNGIGIPEKHHGMVFALFKRLHARDAFGGGTGMGLTIVKKAMERLGGRITLQSPPAGGTAFVLEFAS